jgi:hypothetical protein
MSSKRTIGFSILLFSGTFTAPKPSMANVAHGDAKKARLYYRKLAAEIGFSTPGNIQLTTLDDVAAYLGYKGITGADMQNLPPEILMNPDRLLASCTTPPGTCANSLQHSDALAASLGTTPIQPDDILCSRFFAPKIMNIRDQPATRKNGWRKLVRLRSRPGSAAEAHHIGSGIVLFNFFTNPGETPFGPAAESINTQAMLVTDTASVPSPGNDGPATLYWLDYSPLSTGGALSLALNASFDANELPASSDGTQPYFVPDGCVACHGENSRRSMVNYLDTDHWFDRLDNDFTALKSRGIALLVDSQTNDVTAPSYLAAFEIVRRFNEEADAQALTAQPNHDEVLASQKWLQLHAASSAHFPPTARAIGTDASTLWSADNPNEAKTLSYLNQYCFRCHGSVRFSVFNKAGVRYRHPLIQESIRTGAQVGVQMPPDRPLPDDVRQFLLEQLPQEAHQ